MRSGGAKRIVAGRGVPIPEIGPTERLEAAAGRVAIVVGAEIEIRNAVSGELVSRIGFTDSIIDVALSGTTLVLGLGSGHGSGSYRVELYDIGTGSLLRSTPVAGVPTELDAEGGRVVFARTGGIWAWDTDAPPRRLWRGAVSGSVSLDGRRLVWAVARRRGSQLAGSRVLALTLPR